MRAVYVLPNVVTLSSSYNLFPLSISFGGTPPLQSSIISPYYCTAHYTSTSVKLWVFLSNRAISTLVSLSYVFNFSCPQISANLKSPRYTKQLLHIINRNLTHSLFSSIVELRKNKTRYFQKLHSDFFCNMSRLNDIKG